MGQGQGVAFPFWERVTRELARQRMSQQALVKASGIPATTINNLQTSTRKPLVRIVAALSDALGIDYDEALYLAGHPVARPASLGDETVDLSAAIRSQPGLTEEQKQTLLQMAATYEQLNAQAPVVGRSEDRGASRTA